MTTKMVAISNNSVTGQEGVYRGVLCFISVIYCVSCTDQAYDRFAVREKWQWTNGIDVCAVSSARTRGYQPLHP